CPPRQPLDPGHFTSQLPAPRGREPVSLLSPRVVPLLDTLDPFLVEQAPQRSVQSARTEPHAPVAHPRGGLQDRIAVARLLRQAEQNQQDRLANLHYVLR